jgi:putative addiction module killer protein
VKEFKILNFKTDEGKEPFIEWFKTLDKNYRKRIFIRMDRIESGNFGEYKNLGEGVSELKFTFGSGYRIYFGKDQDKIIILLCGGDKKTQSKDIIKAKQYWRNYNEQK